MSSTLPSEADRALAAAMRDFALLLSDEHDADSILAKLGQVVTEVLPVDGVGVLLRDPDAGGLAVATANTEPGRIVESLEAELREGPCTECMQTGEQILVPDLRAAADRYPRFVPRAIAAGVYSVHGLPLTVRTEQFGSLDIVGFRPEELSAHDLAVAQLLADVAVAYLANRRVLDRSTELTRQLQNALDSRIVIEQAKGVLSERHGIGVSEAFERIRTYARGNRVKVHDVAREVLSGDLQL